MTIWQTAKMCKIVGGFIRLWLFYVSSYIKTSRTLSVHTSKQAAHRQFSRILSVETFTSFRNIAIFPGPISICYVQPYNFISPCNWQWCKFNFNELATCVQLLIQLMRMYLYSHKQALSAACCWLFHPFSWNMSTRGNLERALICDCRISQLS